MSLFNDYIIGGLPYLRHLFVRILTNASMLQYLKAECELLQLKNWAFENLDDKPPAVRLENATSRSKFLRESQNRICTWMVIILNDVSFRYH